MAGDSTPGPANVTAFVSYAHRDLDWDDATASAWQLEIGEFCTALRRYFGVDVEVDLFNFSTPGVDWTRYGQQKVVDSDFVICVLTEAWRDRWEGRNAPGIGAGAVAETNAIRSVFEHNQQAFMRKVVLVQLPSQRSRHDLVPVGLHGVTRFQIDDLTPEGVEPLARLLFNANRFRPSDLAGRPEFESVDFPDRRAEPPDDVPRPPVADMKRYLDAVVDHCSALPSWFPAGASFDEIKQQVVVTAATDTETTGLEAAEGVEEGRGAVAKSRYRQDCASAMSELRQVLLVGEAGSGKSWAIRSRAIQLAREATGQVSGSAEVSLPIIAAAPRVEAELGRSEPDLDPRKRFAEALVRSMPDAIQVDTSEAVREYLIAAIVHDRTVHVLIDGFDEIRSERSLLGGDLRAMSRLLVGEGRTFVLSTRPSAIPAITERSALSLCEVAAFDFGQQSAFIETWLAASGSPPESAAALFARLDEADGEIFRSPLLLALLCSVADDDQPLPATELVLWDRALKRLASAEERHGMVPEDSEIVRRRIVACERLAGQFVGESSISDVVSLSEIRPVLDGIAETWSLDNVTVSVESVLSDLQSTGIVEVATLHGKQSVSFLHSAARDYLIARSLHIDLDLGRVLPRIWSQPEWEPIVSMIAGLRANRIEVVDWLIEQFDNDPLNVARLVAGKVLAACDSAELQSNRRSVERVIDELVILVFSRDSRDFEGASVVLTRIPDEHVVVRLKALLNYSVPSDGIDHVLGCLGSTVVEVESSLFVEVVSTDLFTEEERQAAVAAMTRRPEPGMVEALASIALNPSVPPTVRASAAFHQWRLAGDRELVESLLVTDDDESQAMRRCLAEKVFLANQLADVDWVSDRIASAPDAFCRVILGPERELPCMIGKMVNEGAFPANEALTTLISAVDICRSRAVADPLFASAARFLNSLSDAAAEWEMATLLNEIDGSVDGITLWNSLITRLDIQRGNLVGAFLFTESKEAPDPVASAIVNALPHFDGLVSRQFKTGDSTEPQSDEDLEDDESGDDEALGAEGGVTEANDADLETLFSTPDYASADGYRTLRALRRQIPASGDVRMRAANLTHQIAVVRAIAWIDAEPGLANVVENRLEQGTMSRTAAMLRLQWPGRLDEVIAMPPTGHPEALETRAQADVLLRNFDNALVHAMASMAAYALGGDGATVQTLESLLIAGAYSPEHAAIWNRVHRETDPAGRKAQRTGREYVLHCWTLVPNSISNLNLDRLAHSIISPDIAALRILSGDVDQGREMIECCSSWYGCQRTIRMLEAVERWPVRELVVKRCELARGLLEERAAVLAMRWPAHGLYVGRSNGKPEWHDQFKGLALSFLKKDMNSAAVRVFEDAVERAPHDAELRHNLGFCCIPENLEAAELHLERAAEMFGTLVPVNIACRMHVAFMGNDFQTVLDLADVWRRGCEPDDRRIYFWDLDDPTVLRDGVSARAQIATLAYRATNLVSCEPDVQNYWEQKWQRWSIDETELAVGGESQ